MSDDPRLSVVIPLYNKRETIERALKSVLAQTHSDFDLIVVDDGSTDGSAKAIEAIRDSRVRIITQNNAGVSVARNRGISEAKGNYICLLDADDEWKPNHLRQILGLIRINPEAGIFSNRYEVTSPSGEVTTRALSLDKSFQGKVDDFFHAYQKSRSLLHSSSACVRRECVESIGGFPVGEPIGEDVYVWLRMAEEYEVMFDARIAVTHHRDAPNRTTDNHEPVIPYYLRYYLNDRSPRKLPKSLRNMLASFVLIYAASSIDRGNRNLPTRYAKLVWPISPKTAAICCALALAPRRLISAMYSARHRNTARSTQ